MHENSGMIFTVCEGEQDRLDNRICMGLEEQKGELPRR